GAQEHRSNAVNVAPGRTRADMLGPFPARLICGATNCHAAEMHKLEAPFLHHTNFVRSLEGFENNRYLLAAHGNSTPPITGTQISQIFTDSESQNSSEQN